VQPSILSINKSNIDVEVEDSSKAVEKFIRQRREKAKSENIVCNNDMVAADAIKHHIFQQLRKRITVHFLRRY